jgi:hypothetical protein
LSAHKEFYCPYLQEVNKHPPGNEQEEKQTPAKCLNGDYTIAKCDRTVMLFMNNKVFVFIKHYVTIHTLAYGMWNWWDRFTTNELYRWYANIGRYSI